MADLKDAAHEYWRQGLNVVLLKGKKPIHEWERWQTERQSEYDFEVFPWESADGFAVIGGSQLNNGLYIGAIDWDVKNVSEEVRELGKRVLNKIPITQIEETPSGGQHWVYFGHVKPSTVSSFHNEAGVELLGEGKLIIMAPSAGYKRLNDNTPTVVNNLEDVFYKALGLSGVKLKQPAGMQTKFWFDREDLVGKPYKKKHPSY